MDFIIVATHQNLHYSIAKPSKNLNLRKLCFPLFLHDRLQLFHLLALEDSMEYLHGQGTIWVHLVLQLELKLSFQLIFFLELELVLVLITLI